VVEINSREIMSSVTPAADTATIEDTDYDAVVVGAGFAGLYTLHRLRDETGLSVKVIEKADDVGGTWYWNRYPGARCDSVSWLYCLSLDKEIRNEWEYSERFPEQSEIQEYQRFVADELGLWKDIEFETEVTAATFDESAGTWEVDTDDGSTYATQFFIPAVGCLSTPYVPDFDGRDDYEGEWYHTAKWPQDGIDFSGKRVGIVGTGSTGIQTIPRVAERAEHFTVFQRTPNYVVPANNEPLSKEDWEEIRENYDELWEDARSSPVGFGRENEFESITEASEEEVERALEERWNNEQRLTSVFEDLLKNEESNERVREFIRSKIREIVDDPETAERLVPQGPTDHPYAAKRPPLGYGGYYETFNRDDVDLVDVRAAPIERLTEAGIRTTDDEYDLDAIIFATGFDAVTGTFEKLNIEGRNGTTLDEKWNAGPRTYLGVGTHEFPNMFTITGPQSPSVLSNMTVAIEQHVEWVTDTIEDVLDSGYTYMEPTADAENSWVAHVQDLVDETLYRKAESWYLGKNIPGKPSTFMIYCGGIDAYGDKLDEVDANGYEGFKLVESPGELE
jgi:cation diffusion facilitator CzcD-associated flavoprotein CzcO